MSEDAMVAGEIAQALGISVRQVKRYATRHRIGLPGRAARRKLSTIVSPDTLDAIDKLADAAGVRRSEMLGRLAQVVVEDGGRTARRMLGKWALPKRRWGGRRSDQ